jgi:hypothetical protein
MSVAQEEIETIVRVAAECDGPLPGAGAEVHPSAGVLPPAIEAALAEVEMELAKAAGRRPTDGAEQASSTPNRALAAPGASAVMTRAEDKTASSGDPGTGIGKLADVLSTEIHEQWRRARSAFDQTVATRAKADKACRDACTALERISRLEEQARLAWDHVTEARREAEALREGVRQAKLHADASARAAEVAADRAKKRASTTPE